METRIMQVPNRILLGEVKRMIAAGHSATIRVKGFSMRLFLESERDIVKLEAIHPADVKVHDVVLAEIVTDHYVLHRVIARNGNSLTLMGDGNICGTENCLDTDVVGVATAFYRKGRSKPDLTIGWKWRTYSKIWLFLTPIRRIILSVYRRLPFTI